MFRRPRSLEEETKFFSGTGKIYFDSGPDLLHVRLVTPELTPEQCVPLLEKVVEKCNELKLVRVLIELRVAEPVTHSNSYLTISAFAGCCSGPLRMAFVEDDPDVLQSLDFAVRETDKGPLDARVFSNVVEAEKWLTRDLT